MKLRAGFTLLELVIVMAVLSLLATFTVPTYQLILSQIQLNSTVGQAVDFIRLAEQKTVTEQTIYGITVTASASTILMYSYNAGTGVKTTIDSLDLPTNITIGTVSFSGNNDVRFATSGAPNYSGTFTLHDSIRLRNRTIEIRPSGNILDNTAEF